MVKLRANELSGRKELYSLSMIVENVTGEDWTWLKGRMTRIFMGDA